MDGQDHFSQTHTKEAFPPKKPIIFTILLRVDVDPRKKMVKKNGFLGRNLLCGFDSSDIFGPLTI